MWNFILKRIILIVPTILIVLFISFILKSLAPGDEVAKLLDLEGVNENYSKKEYLEAYKRVASKHALDQAQFYFSIQPNYFPDKLNRIQPKSKQIQIRKLLRQTKNWELVDHFDSNLQNALLSFESKKLTAHEVYKTLVKVDLENSVGNIHGRLQDYKNLSNEELDSLPGLAQVLDASMKLKFQKEVSYPKFVWNGRHCQFHYWLKQIFSKSDNISLKDGQPVLSKITAALKWTVSLSIFALIAIILFSLLLGYAQVCFFNSWFDKANSVLMYLLVAIPLFWLSTMMVVFFTTPEYGDWTDIFPSVGIRPSFTKQSFTAQFLQNLNQLILPVICMILGSISYLVMQLRTDLLDSLSRPFAVAARAKGLSRAQVLSRHALPNALIPYITIMSGSIPAIFTGSVIIEVIFNIPGVGRLLLDAVRISDWPVVFTILVIISITTVIGFLVGDLLLMKLYPKSRQSFTNDLTIQSSQ